MTGVCRKDLSQNQFLFCEEHLIHGNGTRAYKTAYPSVKKDSTAAAAATRLLKKVKISAYLEKRKAEIAARLDITKERTLRAYARRAYFDPRQLVDEVGKLIPLHRLPRDVAAAVTKIKVRQIKPLKDQGDDSIERIIEVEWDKGDSSREAISKYLGLFEEDNKQQNKAQKIIIRSIPREDMD